MSKICFSLVTAVIIETLKTYKEYIPKGFYSYLDANEINSPTSIEDVRDICQRLKLFTVIKQEIGFSSADEFIEKLAIVDKILSLTDKKHNFENRQFCYQVVFSEETGKEWTVNYDRWALKPIDEVNYQV